MNTQQYAYITLAGTDVPAIAVQGGSGPGSGNGSGSGFGEVAEILRPVPGFALEVCFPAQVAAACVPCGEEVAPGWTYDGTNFAPPAGPPEPTAEEKRAQRLAEIDGRLAAIDRESIRPLRAVADGSATDFDRQKLADLEEEAAALRAERAEALSAAPELDQA